MSAARSPPADLATGGGGGPPPGLVDGVGAVLALPPPAPLLGAPVPPEVVAVVADPPPLDLSHAPEARWRSAWDSASGKSRASCSMSFGIWCRASRSVLSEC